MSKWKTYRGGSSIGSTSADGDLILYDEEHVDGARITLKRGKDFVSVSINIYGWMDHTRFFNANLDAQREYRSMRSAMETLLKIINTPDINNIRVWEAISDFVRRFP